LLVALSCIGAWAAEKSEAVLQTKVEPDWGTLTSGYLVEQAGVELIVPPSGEPVSLVATTGSVPAPVVRALAQWRFSEYQKGGRNPAYLISLKVPVRRKLDPELEQSQSPTWHPPAELDDAIKLGGNLDAGKAAQILSNLPTGEAFGNFRTSLLVYYAKKGAKEPENARKARRELIIWLIRTFPQDSILASPYAIVNASGEPLADSEGATLVKKEWLAALKQYPKDEAVVEGAVSFLRVADPSAALRIAADRTDWSARSNWLGSLYAFAGLGVNALAPDSGEPLATESPTLSPGGLAASFRSAMLESTDLKLILSGVATTAALANNLAARSALPEGYTEYCNALMKHTRELYPHTSLDCAPSLPGTAPIPVRTPRIGGDVAEAGLVKRVQPVYPKEAKRRHLQGTVEFIALIGADGRIHQLDVVRAPFVFFEESYNAVLQWEYRPFLWHGKPVPVITAIRVTYTRE